MLSSHTQSGCWTLAFNDRTILSHSPEHPFLTAIRREKTYEADRGTVKETVTEVERVPLTDVTENGDTAVLSASGHSLSIRVEERADGALSMWVGMRLSHSPVFFGDPASHSEGKNTITFWHCGAAACSLARKDTGTVVGVHPNRKIGPTMDFGCEAFDGATVFRIGREPNGSFRFFLTEGTALDKPKQFTGTSIVIKTDTPARDIVEDGVQDGFEPHFVVIKGRHAKALKALAAFYESPVYRY